jgi:opacity protein-like surface antigen
MRKWLLAAAMCGLAQGAQAADMPDLPILRGAVTDGLTVSRPYWQGFYIGGQAAYGSSDENFNGSTSNMAAALLSNTIIGSEMGVAQWNLGLGKDSQRSSSFGAFTGYNWQWEDVVLGLEASWLHGSFGGSASATEARSSANQLSDGLIHDVTATSTASIAISDLATFRGRAGYAFGCFLPYAFAGVALGNADIVRSFNVQDVVRVNRGDAGVALEPLNATSAQHNHLIYGYTAGLGVDWQLIGGLFLRGEYEYVRFTSAVDTSINTVRGGIGYKF